MKKTLYTAILGTLLLTGCGTFMNGHNQATTVAERHPITVDQQTVSVAIPVDATLTGLSRQSLEELDRFLTAYRTRGHGPVTITTPTGTGNEIDAHQTAANVRSALNSYGLDYTQMLGSTYRTGDRSSAVLVSFRRYVASGPVCGNLTGEKWSGFRNLAAPNFGCADQHNLAAIVADPRDLATPHPESNANSTGLVEAVTLGTLPRDNTTVNRGAQSAQ